MNIETEQDMFDFGKSFGEKILSEHDFEKPLVIELIGDVGVGKTTFAKGFAAGLGIKDNLTSPSFTISKTYAFENNRSLTHYDFYRLSDPGIMTEDLSESINAPGNITVVEWGNTVQNILPPKHIVIAISYNDDYSRKVEIK